MTKEQREILSVMQKSGGTATKAEIVAELDCYFCNGEKHIGGRLSRMVNSGLLVRVKPGVFRIGAGKASKPEPGNENQAKLFAE